MDDAVTFSDMMTGLRKKYLAQLKDRQKIIANFLASCEKGVVTEEGCENMRLHVHSLAGSGATYGFADISKCARAFEHKLDDGVREAGVLAKYARALIAAGDRAVSAGPVISIDAAVKTSKNLDYVEKPVLLVAEDDAAIRDLLISLFAKDMNVVAVKNGREALEALKTCKPDLVILDNVMPEVSGSEVLQSLRANEATAAIPVAMLTADNREKDVKRKLNEGAVEYIVKPIDPNRFADRIRERILRQRHSIAIVDDDPAIREMLDSKFRAIGFRTFLAEKGDDLFQIMEKNVPDLIILDRMMSSMDGVAVLKKLQENEKLQKIPVLMLTACRQEQDVREGFQLGVADYIIKPFKPEDVIARSLRCLEEKKS